MADPSDRYVEVSADQASRLRGYVVERMKADAQLTQAEIRRRGGASLPTIKDVLDATAKQYWASSLRKVSVGVGWTPMSIENMLDGGEPTMAENGDAPDEIGERVRRIEEWQERTDRRLDELADLIARLLQEPPEDR